MSGLDTEHARERAERLLHGWTDPAFMRSRWHEDAVQNARDLLEAVRRAEQAEQQMCRCEKCGHLQAEPNWCHECGHRTTPQLWAVKFLDELEAARNETDAAEERVAGLQAQLEVAQEVLRSLIASCDLPGDPSLDGDFLDAPCVRKLCMAALAGWGVREPALTHGRHCPCSACAREDWTRLDLGPCGMHGPECPRVYAPIGRGVRESEQTP